MFIFHFFFILSYSTVKLPRSRKKKEKRKWKYVEGFEIADGKKQVLGIKKFCFPHQLS